MHQKDDGHRRAPATGLSQKVHEKQDITEVPIDRTEKCVENRTGKHGRNRTDTEVHQKQDRKVHQKHDSYISAPEG